MRFEGFVDISATLRSGVYLLCHRGVVIYIGQSKTMLGRIYTHRSMWGRKARANAPDWITAKGILFDEVHVCPCPTDKLDALELAMINLYKPKFNIRLKAPGMIEQPFTLQVNGRSLMLNQVSRPKPQIERRV